MSLVDISTPDILEPARQSNLNEFLCFFHKTLLGGTLKGPSKKEKIWSGWDLNRIVFLFP
jgi:hypothetical protein